MVNGIGFTYHNWQNYNNVLNSYKGAIALVDPSGYVWHFISYGGTVTAVDGAAAGLVANDVGSVMANGHAEFRSIMLFGDGRILSDFYWGEPDNKTLGVYNDEWRLLIDWQTIQPVGTMDTPPFIETTTPKDKASEFPLADNILIDFNEAIDYYDGFATITCARGGTRAFAASGPTTGDILTLNPSANLLPADTCTVTVRADYVYDLDGDTADYLYRPYSWTFTTYNQAPVATPSTQTVLEDSQVTFTLTGTDPEALPLSSFSVVSAPTLGTLTGTPPNLTYKPNPNVNGTDSFTFVVRDNLQKQSAPAMVTVNITPVNDQPNFQVGSDITVAEDYGTRLVSPWASNFVTGPADEAGQTYSFTAVAGNSSLFSVQPTVDVNGVLSFTTAPNANGSTTVNVTMKDNGGTANGGVDSITKSFVITILPVNDAPSFTGSGNVTVNEDSGAYSATWAKSISVGPADESSQTLSFVLSNNDNGLFSVQPAISPTGVLTFTPYPNRRGVATVQVYAQDTGGTANGGNPLSPVTTFTITVNPVNDQPYFTVGADHTSNEDAGGVSVSGWATGISTGATNETAQSVYFEVTNNTNTALFSVAPAVSPTGTLTYTAAPDANGEATISIRIRDTGGTDFGGIDTGVTQTFKITVDPVNDAPSFDPGANITEYEHDLVHSYPGWATNMVVGPGNESAQTYEFILTHDNPGLFDIAPAIATDGTLSFTLNNHVSGVAHVKVTMKDSGGTLNGGKDTSTTFDFVITVLDVNDAPSFTIGPNQTVDEDSGSKTVTNWATNIYPGGADETDQILTFNVTKNDNEALFSSQPTINSQGTLTFIPAANRYGVANITITLSDNGGTANNGADTSAPQTFTITVEPINDAPLFSAMGDQAVPEDMGAVSVADWAYNMLPGPWGETEQTLSFILSTNNNALFSVLPKIDANGTLTFTPASNINGDAVVSVLLRDSGSNVAPNVNTSPVYTFNIGVIAVNDAPSFDAGESKTVLEDAGQVTFTDWATNISAGPTDEAGQTVTFVTTNTNNALFSVQPSVSSTGTLTFTPAANQNGTATVTIYARDNGGTNYGGDNTSDSQTFTITVTSVNDAPSFSVGPNQIVLEDTTAQSVAGWATAIVPGPANESTQTASFNIVSVSDEAMFSVLPTVSSTGTLVYTLAPNANGTATVTLNLSDNGGTASGGVDTSSNKTFTITATSVNDAPSFDLGTLSAVDEDAGAQSVTNFATNISAGPSNESTQTLTFSLTNTNNALFSTQPALSSTGTLTYTPAANAHGTATVSVVLKDNGGTANGGVDTSPIKTFTITVNSLNDAPVANDGSIIMEEDVVTEIKLTATDVDGDTLTYTITTAPTHGTAAIKAGTTDVVVYTPDLNYHGTDSFVFTASDGSLSDTGTISLTINSVMDAPMIVDPDPNDGIAGGPTLEYTIYANETLTVAAPGLLKDFFVEPGSEPLTVQVTAYHPGGWTTVQPDGGFTFVSNTDYTGTGTLVYQVVDHDGRVSDPITVTIIVEPNTAPTANALDITTTEDTASSPFNLTGADTENRTLTYRVVTQPANGTVSYDGTTGVATYTPNLDYYNDPLDNTTWDSFTYVTNDGTQDSLPATVRVAVTPVQDPPYYVGPEGNWIVVSGSALYTIDTYPFDSGLMPGFENPDGTGMVFSLVTAPVFNDGTTNHEIFVDIAADGNFDFYAWVNDDLGGWIDVAPGDYTFTYQVCDSVATSLCTEQTATVTVVAAEAPIAYDFTVDPPLVEDDQLGYVDFMFADHAGTDPLTYTVLVEPAHGTFSYLPNGEYDYVPYSDFFGTDYFTFYATFTAGDGTKYDSNVATITIPVTNVPDAPVSSDADMTISYNAIGGMKLTVPAATGLLSTFSDADGHAMTIINATSVTGGVLTINTADGSFTYLPGANFSGMETFTFQVEDVSTPPLTSGTMTVNLVVAENLPPSVGANNFSVAEDVQLTGLTLDASDDHSADATLTYSLVGSATNGTVNVSPNGSFTFLGTKDYHGTGTFSFSVSDGVHSSTGTATITITPVNDTPVMEVLPSLTVNEDELLTHEIKTTDVDITLDAAETLTYSLGPDAPAGASITTTQGAGTTYLGNLSWTPTNEQSGRTHTFTVCATDSAGASDCDYIYVTVNAVNDAPVITNVSPAITVDEDNSGSLTITWTDVDSSNVSFAITSGPTKGTAYFNGAVLTYVPALNENGSDSITIQANDGASENNLSATVVIPITVNPINDLPVLGAYVNQNGTEDVPMNQTFTATDVDNDTLYWSLKDAPVGIVAGGADTATITADPDATGNTKTALGEWTPSNGQSGAFNFYVCVSDDPANPEQVCGPITLTIEAINDAPTAQAQDVETYEDTELTFTLAGDDVDNPQAELEYIVTDPANGTIILNGNQITYTPKQDYNNDPADNTTWDSFTYYVSDGVLTSGDPVTVRIKVIPVNDAPVLPAIPPQTAIEDETKSYKVVATDVDGDSITYTLENEPAGAFIDSSTGEGYWTPTNEQTNVASFDVCADDGTVKVCMTVSVSVQAVNDAPTATPQTVSVDEDNSLEVILAGTDIDNDPATLTYLLVTQPQFGIATRVGKVVTYTPNKDFNGADSFTFVANDGALDSAPATVSITVNPTNDAPTAANTEVTMLEDGTQVVTLLGADIDTGDTLTYSIVAAPANGSLSAISGDQVTYTPNADFNGTDTFTYKVTDDAVPAAESNVATVTVRITAVNDKPSFTSGGDHLSYEDTGTQSVAWATGISRGPSDEDSQTGVFIVSNDNPDLFSTQPAISSAGTLTYTAQPDLFGQATVTVKYQDNGGTANSGLDTSDTVTFVITVVNVNDAPVFTPGNDVTVDEHVGLTTIEAWATGVWHGTSLDSGQTVTFELTNDNNALFAVQPRIDVVEIRDVDGNLTGLTGTLVFEPGDHASGTAIVYVTLTDNGGTANGGIDRSETIEFHIVVNDVNDPPVISDLTGTTNEDTAVDISLSATDEENDPIVFVLESRPSNGSVVFVGNVATYTPYANFFGTDSFEYKAFDLKEYSEVKTVTVTVNPVNDVPVTLDVSESTTEDTAVTITLKGSDVETPAAELIYTIVTGAGEGPTLGTITQNGDQIVYTPNMDVSGTDTFKYYVTDGDTTPADSNISTVTIVIHPQADIPVFTGPTFLQQDPATAGVNENEEISFTVVAYDGDGDDLTYSLIGAPSGSYFDPDTQMFHWTPDDYQNGPFEMEFCVSDGIYSTCVTLTVNVAAVNDLPVADDLYILADEDLVTSIVLFGSDVDNDALTYTITSLPTKGTLTLNGTPITTIDPLNPPVVIVGGETPDLLEYLSNQDINGADSFTFTVFDGQAYSASDGNVQIYIAAWNDAPILVNPTTTQTVDEDVQLTFLVEAEDVDNVPDDLTFSLGNGEVEGMAINPLTGEFTWTPNDFQNGTFYVEVCVTDTAPVDDKNGPETTCEVIEIVVNPINDAPVAADQAYSTYVDVPLAETLKATDVDGDTLEYHYDSATWDPANGTLDVNPDGTFIYTPPTGFIGTVTFQFYVTDPSLEISDTVTVTITVIDPVKFIYMPFVVK